MTALASRTMKARRTSTCPICRGPVHVGNPIGKLGPGTWAHIECVPAVASTLTNTPHSHRQENQR